MESGHIEAEKAKMLHLRYFFQAYWTRFASTNDIRTVDGKCSQGIQTNYGVKFSPEFGLVAVRNGNPEELQFSAALDKEVNTKLSLLIFRKLSP